MDKQELMNKIKDAEQILNELKDEVEKFKDTEQLLNKLKDELEKIKKEKPSLKRVNMGEEYFYVSIFFGEPTVASYIDLNMDCGDKFYKNNNYFYTYERAEDIANKMKFLLKVERLHDIYCPEYKPDWDDFGGGKWYVIYSIESNEYMARHVYYAKEEVRTYFPNKETAQKVCDRLNEELKNKNKE